MLLKRLELIGFKSFANRVAFEFERGISVLVGPNGSGKSNVADAVRWVLGEQSARALRGKSAEEVIFVGSAGRHPLGMAEVAIVLDNADRRLPVDFAEVRLARRLYRSGESEYLINGARARRTDLVALLLEVSLHNHGYTIVGQGAVDELVIQRPEERRAVVEHAADISRHQHRLAEARSGLATTAQNLTRGEDLIAELEPHSRRLRAQAERAERYAARRAELAAVARAYFRRAVAEKQQQASEALSALDRATAACERVEGRIAGGESARQADRAAAADVERRLAELRETLERTHREREAFLGERGVIRERLAVLESQRDGLLARAARSAERVTRLASELACAPTAESSGEGEAAARLARVQQEQEGLAVELAAERRGAEHAREARSKLVRRQQAIVAESEAGQRREQARIAAAAERATRLAAIEERLAEASTRLRAAGAELVAARRRQDSASSAASAAEERRRLARREVQDTTEREQRGRAEAQVARASLEALDRELGGPDGARPGRTDGQRLGAMLHVPAPNERAIAATLADWAEAQIVDEAAALERATAPDADGGQHVLLSGSATAGLASDEFGTRAASLLQGLAYDLADQIAQAEPPVKPVLRTLLGRTVIVANLETALEAARRLRSAGVVDWQVATTDGLVITSFGGWIFGSRSRAADLLSLRRRRAVIEEDLTRADETASAAGRERALVEQTYAAAEAEERATRAVQQDASSEVRVLSSRVEEARAEIRRNEEARRRLPPPVTAIATAGSSPPIDEQLGAVETELEQIDEREAAHHAAVDSIQTRLEQVRLRREQARLELERIRSAVRAREAFIATRTRELEQARADQARSEVDAERSGRTLSEQRVGLEQVEARSSESAAALERLTARVQSAAAERAELMARIEQHESVVARLRAELAAARTVREEALVRRQQTADELERLNQEAAAVAEEWGLEGEGVVQLRLLDGSAPVPPPAEEVTPSIDLAAARRRMQALQRELRSQGSVGESVLDEYREVDERLRFLTAQAADLRKASAELEAVIGELEELMRRGFHYAFARVNAAFSRTFATLFGGGTARLVLTDESDPLRAGVDIVAQPPGKRLQSLMSLSGGERALTSTALIFALLAINPLPFCVLDEVDAALDESNARRFAALLREFSEQTQFIVITHNRATMETARTLYGISMGGDGVTTVVSLRPAEALAATRNGQAEQRAESALQV